jgi:hypothetical protein
MVLKDCRVEIAAAVFIADGVDGGLGTGGWGLGSDGVDDFSEEADGYV